jgi:acetyl esterase/lipase
MIQDAEARARIAGFGHRLGPDVLAAVYALYRDEQQALAVEPAASDLAYGDHPRQRLDLHAPLSSLSRSDGEGDRLKAGGGASGADCSSTTLRATAAPQPVPPSVLPPAGRGFTPLPTATPQGGREEVTDLAPVLVFVHGGGFLRGEKSSPDHPFSAHVGRWAARQGMLGVVINYRLAPDHVFPAGGEDVGAVTDWLRANAARHGGDPERIVLVGTSAGAVHIATHLALRGAGGLAGAVLLSGLYGATPIEAQDSHYVKPEHLEAWGQLIEKVAAADLPLLVACAEFDPPRFQAETLALLQRRLEVRGAMPRSHFASGHNHYSIAVHLGSSRDSRLADEILSFVADCAGEKRE